MKIKIPEFMKEHKELKGICVGGCILTGKWHKGTKVKDENGEYVKNEDGKFIRHHVAAHAHTHPEDPRQGFICFSTLESLQKETTCKHELAHIITGEGHTKKWAEAYVGLETPKWLTVEWLKKKYGFDDEGNEGRK